MSDDKVKCVKGSVDGKDYGLHRASSPIGKRLCQLMHFKGCNIEVVYVDREHAPEVHRG